MNFKQFTEIVNTTEINNLYNSIKEFEVSDSEIDNWIDDVFEHANEIDINKMPYVLDSLYRADDKFMFMSFCMLFEVTFQDLPFITRLEDIPIYEEKYKIFIDTLLIVFEKSYDGIVDCLSAIILNNDPKGELLSKEQYDLLVQTIMLNSDFNDIDKIDKLKCLIYLNGSLNEKEIENIDKEFGLNEEDYR